MEHPVQLTQMDPMPIWSPAPSDHGVRRPRSPLVPAEAGFNPSEGIALRLGPERRIPDDPGSAIAYGPPPQVFAPPPPTGPAYMQGHETRDIHALQQSGQQNFREYLALQREYRRYGGNADRLRYQTDLVLSDLLGLQIQVRDLARAAQNHRYRKWLMGGIFASFIPLVRRIFRRGKDEDSKVAANDTEYAFQRSKSILARIKNSVFGVGKLASIGFFVFAVLYIFQSEVSLRVARTTQRRLKQLADRIHEGDYTLEERDVRALEGWRWRILLW